MDVRPVAYGLVNRDATPALTMRGVAKRFNGSFALAAADLAVRAGSVHALLGENGAGKTTLMRIAFGLVPADAGIIERDGRPVHYRSPRDAIADGIGMVHQHFSLVPAMTVAENVALGGRGLYDCARAIARVEEIGLATGLVVDPRALVSDLSVAAQQRVEIIKVFARGATLLILDEPTAILAPHDGAELLTQLRAFADAGNAVVFITHKLREAREIADEVTVLRRGTTVYHARAAESSEATLVAAMVDATPPQTLQSRAQPRTDIVLQLEHASYTDAAGVVRVRDASLSVRAGEIVGVAGVEGNGQRELLRLLSGRLQPSSGGAELPRTLGFVPEDRHRDALVMEFTLAENFALRGAGSRSGVLSWPSFELATRAVMSAFDVRAPNASVTVGTLSGGNQQRFLLGRELSDSPRALVVESPSRGLDVRATLAVHDQLRQARSSGAAVVIYSSDIDELIELSDRIVVCFNGSVHEVERSATVIAQALAGAPT